MDQIGRCRECGRIIAWTSGENPVKDIAKDVASMIKSNLYVDSIENGDAKKEHLWGHEATCGQKRKRTGR